jgi:hypothetical protein
MPQGSKLVVSLAHHPPFSPYLLPCAWKKERGMKKGESVKKEIGRNTRISKELPSLPP